jgi:GTPase SAR1 family protein
MNTLRYVNSFDMKDFHFNKNLYDSDQFKEIFEYANEKGGLLICARAGTGKSYLFNKWVETELTEDDERTRLAFTNRARRNINGTTIHTAFSINDNGKANKKMMNTYKNKKIIMVDEIGMIGVDLWKHLLMLKKQFPYLVFVLCGDYRQLPPIEIWGTTYFSSEIVKYLCNNNSMELTVRKRYDEEMWNWLEDFYEKGIIDWTKIKVEKHDWNAVNIVYYNKTRDAVNDLFMDHFKPYDAYYLPYTRKDKDDRHKSIYLYKGLPVMSIKNKKILNVINSDELIVDDYDVEKKIIYMTKLDDNEKLEVSFEDFHKIFVCGYAFTVHKIQGATITENINIWNSNVILNDKHIGYTAISRAKKLNQIIIVE